MAQEEDLNVDEQTQPTKEIDFSAFDNAVKKSTKKIDFSAFDNAIGNKQKTEQVGGLTAYSDLRQKTTPTEEIKRPAKLTDYTNVPLEMVSKAKATEVSRKPSTQPVRKIATEEKAAAEGTSTNLQLPTTLKGGQFGIVAEPQKEGELQQKLQQRQEEATAAIDNTTTERLKAKGIPINPTNFRKEQLSVQDQIDNGELSMVKKDGIPMYGRVPAVAESFAKGVIGSAMQFLNGLELGVAGNDNLKKADILENQSKSSEAVANSEIGLGDLLKMFYNPSQVPIDIAEKTAQSENRNIPIGKDTSSDIAGTIGGLSTLALTSSLGLGGIASQSVVSAVGDKAQQIYQTKKQEYLQQGLPEMQAKSQAAADATEFAPAAALPDAFLNAALMTQVPNALTPAAVGFKDAIVNTLKGATKMGFYGMGTEAAVQGIEAAQGQKPEDVLKKIIEKGGDFFLMDAAIVHGLPLLAKGGIGMSKNLASSLKEYLTQEKIKPQVDAAISQMDNGAQVQQELNDYETTRNQIKGLVPEEHIAAYTNNLQEQQKIKNQIIEEQSKKASLPEALHSEIDKNIDTLNSQLEQLNKQLVEFKKSGNPVEHEFDDATGQPIIHPETKLIAETIPTIEPTDNIKVGEMLDKTGTYKGVKGSFTQEGQTVVFKEEGKDRVHEIGNIDEVKDMPISDFDIKHEESIVSVDNDGNFNVRNEVFVNPFEQRGQNPTDAILYDKDGNVVNVRMKTADGKRRTFKGNIAEDLAYQIHLKEINKNNETRAAFEQHINEDTEAQNEINNAGLPKTTEGGTIEGTEQVPQQEVVQPKAKVIKVKTEPVEVLPEGEAKQNEIKAKKADIEKRRKAELDEFNNTLRIQGIEIRDSKGKRLDYSKESINAKYDAELAKLEKENASTETAPKEEKTAADTVHDDLLTHLGITEEPKGETKGEILSAEDTLKNIETKGVKASDETSLQVIKEKNKDNPLKTKIIEQATKASKALKSIFPNMEIHLHENDAEHDYVNEQVGNPKGTVGSFSFIKNEDGTYTGRIDINLNKANGRTIAHEVTHAILEKTFGENKELFKSFREKISSILTDETNDRLSSFSDNEHYASTDMTHEEYLAELSAALSDTKAKINPSTLEKVASVINKFVSKLTGGKFKPFEDIKNTKDVVDFFNKVSESIREGQDLSNISKDYEGKLYEQQNLNLTGKLEKELSPTGRKPKAKAAIKEGVDVEDHPIIDKNSMKGKRYSVTMSDHTKVGEYNNPKTGVKVSNLMGGVFYPYIKGIKDAGIGWASITTKALREMIQNASGQDATLVYRMSRSTGSRGNDSFKEAAFAELVKPVIDGKITEKEFLKQLNDKLNTVSGGKQLVAGEYFLGKHGTDTNKKITVGVFDKEGKRIQGKTKNIVKKEITSLDQLKSSLNKESFAKRGAFWSTLMKDSWSTKSTSDWYKFLEKNSVASLEDIANHLAESEVDNAADHDIVAAVKIAEPEYITDKKGNKIIKIYTTRKNLVNEEKGVFFIDAPNHSSYPYVAKGKPIGIFNEFNHISDYFPAIGKDVEFHKLKNNPYKAVETKGKDLVRTLEPKDVNLTESGRNPKEIKSKAQLPKEEVKPTETVESTTKALEEVAKNNPEKVADATSKVFEDAGFHRGTLSSKSDFINETYIGDLPFTGHYFVSNPKDVVQGGSRKGNEKAFRVVDFSKYNLLKFEDANSYFGTKRALKKMANDLSDVNSEEVVNDLLKNQNVSDRLKNKIKNFNANNDALDINAKIYKLEKLQESVKNNRDFNAINNEIDSLNEKLKSVKKVSFANNLKNILEEYKNKRKTEEFSERLETSILKSLGYEGVDVRGIKAEGGLKSPDGFSEGSVIFDLKPKTVSTPAEAYHDALKVPEQNRTIEQKEIILSVDKALGISTKPQFSKEENENEDIVSASVNVAPLYSTRVDSPEQAALLQNSEFYKEFKNKNEKLAGYFNLKVDNQKDGIGGFAGVSEVTTVVNVTGKFEDIVKYAAINGSLTPEVQESTIAGMYVKKGSKYHNADKIEVGINDMKAAMRAVKDAGFDENGYTLLNDEISFFNIHEFKIDGFEEKINIFESKYKEYGGQITREDNHAVRSEYIDAERRKAIISKIDGEGLQREQDRTGLRNELENAKERNENFLNWKKINESDAAIEYRDLRQKQLELADKGESLSDKDDARIKELEGKLSEPLASIISSDKKQYEKAKKEIDTIANDVASLVAGGFKSEFGIKRPSRAAVKVVRWYDVQPNLLADGARANVIVNTNADADFLFNEIKRRFNSTLNRNEGETTNLGYPKRLIELRTKSGKIAEIQVMTPQGYLAKDGISHFPEDAKSKAKESLKEVRNKLGWDIPDGVGHYFYEIHRDPNVPKSLKIQAEELSNKYYKAFLDSESKLTDSEFRKDITSFKDKVDAANKSKWDNGNEGKSPKTLDKYLEQPILENKQQFSKGDQDSKIKDFIEIQRQKGISDKDIQAGLEKASEKIGIDKAKIDELMSTPKVEQTGDLQSQYDGIKSEKAKKKFITKNFGEVSEEQLSDIVKNNTDLQTIKDKIDAIQKSGAGEVLQRKQEGNGSKGGKRGGMEQGEQGATITTEKEGEKVGGGQGISKAAIKSKYGFSKKFENKSYQSVADNVQDTLQNRADNLGISVEQQAANEVSNMKNKVGEASEHDIMTAALHLNNLDAQIEKANNANEDTSVLLSQREDALTTLRQLGNNAGRNLRLFAMAYKVTEEGKLEVIKSNLKNDLGVDNIPKSVAELNASNLSKEEKDKLRPYVAEIQKVQKDLADIKFETDKKIKEATEKGLQDYVAKQKNTTTPVSKGAKLSIETAKKVSNSLRNLADKVENFSKTEAAKGAQTQGIDIQKSIADAIRYVADKIESGDIPDVVARAIEKFAGEGLLEKDLKSKLHDALISAGIPKESLEGKTTKENAIEKIKGLAKIENATTITKDMASQGLVNDIFNDYIKKDIPYEELVKMTTDELKKTLPNVTESDVLDVILNKGEFKKETKEKIKSDIQVAKENVKRLANTQAKINALQVVSDINDIKNDNTLSVKEKKDAIEVRKSEYEKGLDDKLKELQKQSKIAKVEQEINYVKNEKNIYNNALKEPKKANAELQKAQDVLKNEYNKQGIRKESGSKTEIKIAQDSENAINEIKNSNLPEDIKKEHIKAIEDQTKEQLNNTKQGVLNNLKESIDSHISDLINKAKDALDNKMPTDKINELKRDLQDLSNKLKPNLENLKDQIDKADQDLQAIIESNKGTEFAQDLKNIQQEYHKDWQKTSNELQAKELTEKARRSVKEAERRMAAGQFTEIPNTELDIKTNEILAKEEADKKTAWSKLTSMAQNAREQKLSKSITAKVLEARRDIMIASFTAIEKVGISGITKPILDPLLKQTFGRLSSLITGIRPTEAKRLGGTLRQLKNESSANSFMAKMNDKYIKEVKEHEKLLKEFGADSPQEKAALKKLKSAELDNETALAYLFINAGSHIDIAQVMLKGATDFDAKMGKYKQSFPEQRTKMEGLRFWIESVNRSHGAIKSISHRQSLLDHYIENLQYFQDKNGNITPENRTMAWDTATLMSEEGRFGEKTLLSDWIAKQKNSENAAIRNTANFAAPVAKIGINIAKQGIDMAMPFELLYKTTSLVKEGIKKNALEGKEFNNALTRIREGLKTSFDDLPLEQKKRINTLITRGLFGVAQYALVGYMLGQGKMKFGGSYDENDPFRRNKVIGADGTPLDYGEWEINGVRLPKLVGVIINHSPYFLPAALATVAHQQYNSVKEKDATFIKAVSKVTNEVYERLPIANAVGIAQAVMGNEYKLEHILANEVPTMKNVAEYTDKDAQGNPIKRETKGEGFLSTTGNIIISNIPGARQTLPIKYSGITKSASSSRIKSKLKSKK